MGYVGDQYDENGLINRDYYLLKKGDVVRINRDENMEFTVESEDVKVERLPIEDGQYRYQITAVGIDNSYVNSNYAIFQVKKGVPKAVQVLILFSTQL